MGDLNKEDEDEVGYKSVQNDHSTNDSFQLYDMIEYMNRIIFAVLDVRESFIVVSKRHQNFSNP